MNFAELHEMELYSAKRCAIYFADRCKLLEHRIEQLEQLCRILFNRYDPWDYQINDDVISYDEAYDRMTDLGLLDGEQ